MIKKNFECCDHGVFRAIDLLLEHSLLLLLRNRAPLRVVQATLTKSYQLWPQSLDCPLQLVLRAGVPLVGFVRVAA